ncbi:MAG TPA: hypothetical protein PKY30_02420 [Myxococcota bacterium]|nr:hypothetical protein [Myxococcota bacterium]HNH45860.1 hypothetical protein [Myxococcota bacterium]
MLSLLLSSLVLAADSSPPKLELSFQGGWTAANDPRYEVLSSSNVLGSIGLRAGVRVHPRLAVVLDWQHGGSLLQVDSDEDDIRLDSSFNSAFTVDQIGVGVLGDLKVGSWFRPYATVQGVLAVESLRLDDDPDHDDNSTQVHETGVGGGVYGALGVEFRIPLGKSGLALAPYTEWGGSYLSDAKLGQVGAVSFGGFAGRAGIGLRF